MIFFILECQKFYNKNTYHRFNCKGIIANIIKTFTYFCIARCKDCGRVKYGQCERQTDYEKEILSNYANYNKRCRKILGGVRPMKTLLHNRIEASQN